MGGHRSSAEIWGSQIPVQTEFVQVREFQGSSLVRNSYKCGRDVRGPPTCPRPEETHAWAIRGLATQTESERVCKNIPVRPDGEGGTVRVREIWGSRVHPNDICASVGGPRSALV